ncbi:MAG: Gfo/Idh/MocA family oxidoreductase [Cyanobacteria bacterium J06581_3]
MTQDNQSKEQIDLVLLGAGRWGTHLLRNFLAHPQIRLRAVVEASEERLQTLREELDESVALLSDWRAAMDLDGLDGCAIATPAATHYDLIETALKKGLHVLAEKPLTLDTASSQSLCDLAKQQNKQLVIDHTYLFHSAVTAGKSALSNIGTLRYGYATRTHLGPVRRDVDALWDLAIHDISIFNHWLGESAVRVQARGSTWLQSDVSTALSPTGLADIVWCRLQYPSGFQATIHLCWANPDKQRRLCVVGNKGTLIFDEMNQDAPLVQQMGDFAEKEGWFVPQNTETVPVEVPESEPLKNVCDHFVKCVRSSKPSNISSGQQGTDLVSVLVALSESMKKKGEWIIVGQ